MGITGGGIYITLHSLDWHVRDVTQKVHLMSDMVLFPNSSVKEKKKKKSAVSSSQTISVYEPSRHKPIHTSDDSRLVFIPLAIALINIGNNKTMMTTP